MTFPVRVCLDIHHSGHFVAIILALLISSIWGDRFINLLKRKQITETQRDASIDPFGVNKVGVPSMGGVIIIVAILIPCLLLGKLSNIYMILMLITTVWLGSLGFADDYIKIFKKDKEGLHGKLQAYRTGRFGVNRRTYFIPESASLSSAKTLKCRNPGRKWKLFMRDKTLSRRRLPSPSLKAITWIMLIS